MPSNTKGESCELRLEKDLRIWGFWAHHSLSELNVADWWVAGTSRAHAGGFLNISIPGGSQALLQSSRSGGGGLGGR